MTFALPGTSAEMLFWSTVILVWMTANYLLPVRPAGRAGTITVFFIVRALLPPAGILLLGGVNTWKVGLLLVITGTALPIGRTWLAPRRLRAEVELVCNTLLLAGSAVLIGSGDLVMRLEPGMGVPPDHWSAAFLVLAGAIFLVRGGAEVVRGILEKAESIPLIVALVPDQPIVQEFNRGRLIGYLERLLIMAIIMAGQFGALGVLVAAKGLIRSRELERLEFAEYFLVGTLASITIAFFVGLGLRGLVLPLW